MKNILPLIVIVCLFAACTGRSGKDSGVSKLKDAIGKMPADTAHYPTYDNDVKSLGIGLVIAPSKFELFNDSLLSNKYQSIDMGHDEKYNVAPKYFSPDHGIMHFVCLGQSDKAYRVLVNYSDIRYMPKATGYDLVTWENYITRSLGVRHATEGPGKTAGPQILNERPDDKAKPVSIPKGYEMFCPIEVKGDWVKVTYDCFYNDENGKHEGESCHDYIKECSSPVNGWLRWRKDAKVLIDILVE